MNISKGTRLDRSDLFPVHEGPNILPNNPLFTRLLRHAHRERTAIQDFRLNVSKTYGELLSDALSLREVLRQCLDPQEVAKLNRDEEVYIGVLAPGGYEFAVAMIAVLALGAAVVPMSVSQPAAELGCYVTKAKQAAIVCSLGAAGLARETIELLRSQQVFEVPYLEVLSSLPPSPRWKPQEIVVSASRCQDDNAPGVVIFTSGTTGRPKGCVLRRLYIHDSALSVIDSNDIQCTDKVLHVLPVHHATGIGTSFFPFMNAGACVCFRSGSFDPGWVWQQLCSGEYSIFSGVPTMYMRLMWHYQNDLAGLSEHERQNFDNGINKLKALLCGSSALQQRAQDFWTDIRGGRPILVRYGSSEVPAVIRVPARLDPSTVPRECVGIAAPGVDLKLSEEGELLLRTPHMFSKYLDDRPATVEAHAEDGWFRTGDLAHVDQNGFVFIDGRLSTDIIKSGGYKIGAPDVERAILELGFVDEAMVVGVDDEEYGQRVGAVLTMSKSSPGTTALRVDDLRSDLRKSLPGYKIPTLLRIVHGELPKGETGKVQKKILGPKYFVPEKWRDDAEVQVWEPTRSKL